MKWFKSFLGILFAAGLNSAAEYPSYDKCTTIVIGKDASLDGSVMVTHTADCAECDWRINKVPRSRWPKDSLRPIYLITGAYPRQVREDRGWTWSERNLENVPEHRAEWTKIKGPIIGYIPQIEETFAIIEGMYGIMNEYQVSIGESTCASKLWAAPSGSAGGGRALLEASELSQIALERSKTAQDAIRVMGNLAVKYGFYSAEWDTTEFGEDLPRGEGGEALTVIDTTEAWVMHIIPDHSGSSAIWVAQRLPADHVSVVANTFTIRAVDPDSPDFLFSENLWTEARLLGWWSDSDGLLDFKKTYAPPRYRPHYSDRRVWRVLTEASGLSLPAEVTTPLADEYPFSVAVPPARRLSVFDVQRLQRDHYEGTPYSTAEGLAAGPYGDPNRFDVAPPPGSNMTLRDVLQGEFPRAISLYRTSYAFVAQARSDVPRLLARLWLGQYAPDVSTFLPLYIAASQLPSPLTRGTMHEFSTDSIWWNHCVVGNYAARMYKFAMAPVRGLQAKQQERLAAATLQLERGIFDTLSGASKRAKRPAEISLKNASTSEYLSAVPVPAPVEEELVKRLTDFISEQASIASNEWRDLLPFLFVHFRDGYALRTDQATIGITRLFYPDWWLRAVGYYASPPNQSPDAILFGPSPDSESRPVSFPLWMLLVSVLLAAVISSLLTRAALSSSASDIAGMRRDKFCGSYDESPCPCPSPGRCTGAYASAAAGEWEPLVAARSNEEAEGFYRSKLFFSTPSV